MNKKKPLYPLFLRYCYLFQVTQLIILISSIGFNIVGVKYRTLAHAYTITTPNNPYIFIGTDITGNKIIQVIPPVPEVKQPQQPLIIVSKVSIPWEPTTPNVAPLDTVIPTTQKVQPINPISKE